MTANVLSLFAGIGGFDLAYERAGATVVGHAEIDVRCATLLANRFPGVPLTEDVRDVQARPGDADIIVGGFPCQDVSTAGKRAGLAGARSGLWHEYARIIDDSRPRWVVVENVAGLLSSNGGADFGTVLGSMVELGYGVAWRVLDAQFFGVPQRRRRVFIVGHRGDPERAGQVLLEREGGNWNPPARSDAGAIASALTQSCLGGGGPDDNNAQANHLIEAFHNARTLHADGEVVEYNAAEISNALTQPFGNKGTVLVEPEIGVRKLMPIECERLQGFPDNWTEGFPDTTRYRMLGNAVAVPVVEWIARRMLAVDAA